MVNLNTEWILKYLFLILLKCDKASILRAHPKSSWARVCVIDCCLSDSCWSDSRTTSDSEVFQGSKQKHRNRVKVHDTGRAEVKVNKDACHEVQGKPSVCYGVSSSRTLHPSRTMWWHGQRESFHMLAFRLFWGQLQVCCVRGGLAAHETAIRSPMEIPKSENWNNLFS